MKFLSKYSMLCGEHTRKVSNPGENNRLQHGFPYVPIVGVLYYCKLVELVGIGDGIGIQMVDLLGWGLLLQA